MSELDLTCSGLADEVTDYLEHALDARRTLSFETHAVFCTGCRVFLDQTRETIERLRGVPPEPVGAGERDAILAAYKERA